MANSRYTPQTWINGQAGGTPIDATRLSYIESGIAAAYGAIYTNVLDYGADPTGTNDSTPAINAALAAGPNCIIPKGIFLTTTPLNVNAANTHILLEGEIHGTGATSVFSLPVPTTSLLINGGGSVLGTSTVPAFIIPSGSVYTGIQNILMHSTAGIVINGSNVTVSGCFFVAGADGINCSGGASLVTISNNNASSCTAIDYDLSASTYITCVGNISQNNSGTGGFNLASSTYVTLANNIVHGSTGYGYSVGTVTLADFAITGNVSIGTTGDAFHGSASALGIITGNCGDTGAGITASGSTTKTANTSNV